MMVYNETYVARAVNVFELTEILKHAVPSDATIEVGIYEHDSAVEVWYDKDTNTVILK